MGGAQRRHPRLSRHPVRTRDTAGTAKVSVSRREFLTFISATDKIIVIRQRIQACRDPDDDKFLEIAMNGGAGWIVTGDADLLALHPFEGIAIITPAEFLHLTGP
jgi:predicted nucleic acid-binding protein